MLIEAGKVGIGRYEIHNENKVYRVFIGNILRASKKTIRGAYGVIRAIDPKFISDSNARMAASNLEARTALLSNTCPLCNGDVHRNLSITGWVQCDGFGSDGFRKDPNATPCHWQGFTGE